MNWIRAALVAALLLWCPSAHAAYSLIAHTGAQTVAGFNITTSAIDTTGADLLIVIVYTATGVPVTPTDSKSNTWTALTNYSGSNTVSIRTYYSRGGTVGSGHTFTETTSGVYPSIAVLAFSGSVASPFDLESGNSGGAGPGIPGSVTPSENDEVLISGCASFPSSTLTNIGSGWTTTDSGNAATGTAYGASYKIQTTAGAENPQWTGIDTGAGWATNIATFKASGGGGGGGTISPKMPLLGVKENTN